MYEPEEAVARFFPAGGSYDRNQAKRLIRWLDSCGYELIRKDQASASEPELQSAMKTLPQSLRAILVRAERRKSA